MRDRAVDPPVDTRKAGGDLVDDAVEVVDPGLERDREVDEIGLPATEQHGLAGAEPAHAASEHHDREQGAGCDRAGDDRDDERGVHRTTARTRR